MGIIVKYFLEYPYSAGIPQSAVPSDGVGTAEDLRLFSSSVKAQYPCCADPVADMCGAIRFWSEISRVVSRLNESIDVAYTKDDMDAADKLLMSKAHAIGLHTHRDFPQPL